MNISENSGQLLRNTDSESTYDFHLATQNGPFRTISIAPHVLFCLFQSLSLVGCLTFAFLYPSVGNAATKMETLTIVLYISAALWLAFLAIEIINSNFYRRKFKLYGYLKFYKSSLTFVRLPLAVKAGANTILLVLVTVNYGHCSAATDCCVLWNTCILVWLQVVLSIETALTCLNCLWFIVRLVQFHRSTGEPDIISEMNSGSWGQNLVPKRNSVGYRSTDDIDELLEHQADMIRSLQEQSSLLSRKLCERQ